MTVNLDRRTLIRAGAGLVAAPFIARAGFAFGSENPFTLGVASGDPAPDGFVIWTRLATEPLALDGHGGMGPDDIPVRWEVATDEAFRNIVRRGITRAEWLWAHSVHVEVAGLRPHTPYFYRFSAMGAQSRVGRAATAPRPNAPLASLKIAVASCSNYEAGYFAAYRHMANEQPDLAVFLGDYIYEYTRPTGKIRHHDRPGEIFDLSGYRNRYALHKMDEDLQALHAAVPMLMTWDDHEVQNDYAGEWSWMVRESQGSFRERRASAHRAYWENMPLRRMSMPRSINMRIYDQRRFGNLAEFLVLDGRQYRSMQPCPTPERRGGRVVGPECADRTDPNRTMLGQEQETWLYDRFRRVSAQWTIVAQDLNVAQLSQRDLSGRVGNYTDGWDGYPATRDRMLAALAAARTPNPVFLSGDIHAFFVNDLKADFNNPASATLATEFTGTSITSNGPPYELFMAGMAANPHVKFFDSRQRGYMSIEITPQRMTTRLQAISNREDPHATLSTLKTYVVENGRAGAVEA